MINKIATVELSEFEAECPKDFELAIMQCFEANPDNRPSALEFIDMVENVKFDLQQSSTTRGPEQVQRPMPTKMRFEKIYKVELTFVQLKQTSRCWWKSLLTCC